MTPKTMGTIAAVAAVSILLGISPALAQASQSQQQSQQATFAIQMAQAAQSYAENAVNIGQQHGLNVTQSKSLISQGDQLLAKAENELGTDSTLAIQDALGAMRDYHAAVQSVMAEAATLFQQESQADMIQRAKDYVGMLQNRTVLIGNVLAKACAVPDVSNSTCADGRSNLATASSDLGQAASILATSNPDLSQVKSLVTDAQQHLSVVASDINQLAHEAKAEMAIDYIKSNLEPRIVLLQQYAQKANLSASVQQQVQSLLSNAQTDLSNAIQAFQSGNFSGGVQTAQQAIQLMQQAATLIQQNARP